MPSTDLQVVKDIPGYKVILKAVIKSQIQQLVEQLANHTGEESVLLTASVSDGSLSHLGSESGKVFLENHDDIKAQFLVFLKHHKLQKQTVAVRQPKQEQVPDLGGKFQKVPTLPTTQATTRKSSKKKGISNVKHKSSKKKGISNVKHERNTASYQISRVEKLSTEPGIHQDINIYPDEKMEAMEDEDYLEILPIDQTELVSGFESDSDSADGYTSGNTAIDSDVNVKLEKIANSYRIPELQTGINRIVNDLQPDKPSDKPSLFCRYCGKIFHNKNTHKSHERKHRGNAPYTCSYCNKESFNKFHHERHLATHSDEKNFVCSNCGKAFKALADLKSHEKREKRDLKFSCEVCGKLLESKQELKDHLTKHTGERSHVCEYCGASFRYSSNLYRHKKLHSKTRKVYECNKCHKVFSTNFNLREHELICVYKCVEKCGICNKEFKCKRYLKEHERKIHKLDIVGTVVVQ